VSDIEVNKINYAVMIVYEFAKQKQLNPKQAFLYLLNNNGISFIKEHYEVEHTLSIDEAINDLTIVCNQNGGALS